MNAGATPSLRLFYALWPDDDTRAALMRVQAPIVGHKARYENLHLTLVFLGQQPANRLPALKKILTDLPPTRLSLDLDRVGYFTQTRIAWAGMHAPPDALIGLQRNLVEQLVRDTIAFNGQSKFRPHITLARDAAPPEELPFECFTWHADQVALVESRTQPDGVIYRVLEIQSLNGNH